MSLVATLKIQPALDASLEAKAVKFLESVDPRTPKSADAFLRSLARNPDESITHFVQSFPVLITTPSKAITTATVEMLKTLIMWCSAKVRLALIKADLIPQLINTVNPLSLSLTEAESIHMYLLKIISYSLWLATPNELEYLKISDNNEQQAVRETVFQQVLVPSENYLSHFCVNRFWIVDEELSALFLTLIAQLLQIYPYHQPTTEYVLHLPVFLTIPSCLTFFENDWAMHAFLASMAHTQREWNEQRIHVRQMGIVIHRMLRMEGIEDVIEEKLQNDKNRDFGEWIVARSIELNNQQGMNDPKLW